MKQHNEAPCEHFPWREPSHYQSSNAQKERINTCLDCRNKKRIVQPTLKSLKPKFYKKTGEKKKREKKKRLSECFVLLRLPILSTSASACPSPPALTRWSQPEQQFADKVVEVDNVDGEEQVVDHRVDRAGNGDVIDVAAVVEYVDRFPIVRYVLQFVLQCYSQR